MGEPQIEPVIRTTYRVIMTADAPLSAYDRPHPDEARDFEEGMPGDEVVELVTELFGDDSVDTRISVFTEAVTDGSPMERAPHEADPETVLAEICDETGQPPHVVRAVLNAAAVRHVDLLAMLYPPVRR